MADVNFSYRLALIVRLVDTTTGLAIPEHQILFTESGQALALHRRGNGLYVLLNHDRANMTLQIDAKGYEPVAVTIDYERLSPQFPELEIPLIPLQKEKGFEDFYTIRGVKPGLTAVTAVRVEKPVAVIGSYVERRRMLKLFSARMHMDEHAYALLHQDTHQYEEILVEKRPDRLSMKLLHPLSDGCKAQDTLLRIVRGRVESDGTYLLRVRDLGGSNVYLVRYEGEHGVSYEQIDFETFGDGKRKEETQWDYQ